MLLLMFAMILMCAFSGYQQYQALQNAEDEDQHPADDGHAASAPAGEQKPPAAAGTAEPAGEVADLGPAPKETLVQKQAIQQALQEAVSSLALLPDGLIDAGKVSGPQYRIVLVLYRGPLREIVTDCL
jgi:hypothetical protein